MIGFFVTLYAEFTEWDDMVNVKSAIKFSAMLAAMLASMLVACACFAALGQPVFSVIWFVAAFPSWAVFAAHPVYFAVWRTKDVFLSLVALVLASECLAAILAYKRLAPIVRFVIDTLLGMFRHPFTTASWTAKVMFARIGYRRKQHHDLTAPRARKLDLAAFPGGAMSTVIATLARFSKLLVSFRYSFAVRLGQARAFWRRHNVFSVIAARNVHLDHPAANGRSADVVQFANGVSGQSFLMIESLQRFFIGLVFHINILTRTRVLVNEA